MSVSEPSIELIEEGEGSRRPTVPIPNIPAPRWAWLLLGFLFLSHFLASVDSELFTALILPLGSELELWDHQAEWLTALPLLAGAVWAPTLGYFADRMRRPRLLALGIAGFGLATVAMALANSFPALQQSRTLAGVGTVTFGVVALTMLMDAFPRTVRGRVLAIYFLAAPLGTAVALNLGPVLAVATTWQTAFLVLGAPALLLALGSLALPEPVRGLSEGTPISRLRAHEARGATVEDYIDLMVNSSYTYSLFGLTFAAFALSGLSAWLPTFLMGVRGLPEAQANAATAAIPPAGAAVGLLLGGWLCDRWSRLDARAPFLIGALAAAVAAPLWVVMTLGPGRPWQFATLFSVVALTAVATAPCYAILAAVSAPNLRGVACGAATAVIHLLGVAWAPRLLGWGAEVFGQPDAMATSFGRLLAALGATPRTVGGRAPENVSAALLFAAPTLAAAGFVLLAGARHLSRESALMLAKLRSAPPSSPPRRASGVAPTEP